MNNSALEQYPQVAYWILNGDGWIELGQNDFSLSTIRILDAGGLIWESQNHYESLTQMLADAETALCDWLKENDIT